MVYSEEGVIRKKNPELSWRERECCFFMGNGSSVVLIVSGIVNWDNKTTRIDFHCS